MEKTQGKRAMKRYGIFILILFLIGFMNSSCSTTNDIKDLKLSGKVESGVRVVEVRASRYKFEPDPIVVQFGEKVRLIVTSTDVSHGIAISEFNVNLSVPAGKIETVEFIADKKGEFPTHCSVYCGPDHAHMHGSFMVK